MLDDQGTVLYIGKAKNLKKRVTSYFKRQLDAKTLQLVKQIKSIEITVTRNEREALLLESNLIKSQKPRYNVIFKDDKSYPYLWLSNETFPRLTFYRGTQQGKGHYFGPYPSAREAREALALLQSIFKLRQCDEVFFKNRTRPCLQYQIKRCSAPCVGYIPKEEYQEEVKRAELFLEGKNLAVIEQLIFKMDKASEQLDFEMAAILRDQIALLRGIQEQQIIMGHMTDVDILGIAVKEERICIHLLVIREGRMLGSRQYFSKQGLLLESEFSIEQTALEAFLLQHYSTEEHKEAIPKTILVSHPLKDPTVFMEMLANLAGHGVKISHITRGKPLKWVGMAVLSATKALGSQSQKTDLSPRFLALQESLQLESIPERIECFDVSHTLGESTVVSCVVFDAKGPVKSDYRRFSIRAETKGDDYQAMTEGLMRHYTRLKSEEKRMPDILIVDGGKGQLGCAKAVLEELQVVGVLCLAVAKGPKRKAGLETVYMLTELGPKLVLPSQLALLLIQQVRDEAHRFAISLHRKQRAKRRIKSTLEDISGVGQTRRNALLRFFGGLQEVLQASAEEMAKVPGISRALAERIYDELHGS